MTSYLPEKRNEGQISNLSQFSTEKRAIIKKMYCKDCTDDEFELFLNVCEHTGLDPTMKQIHPVKRKSKDGTGSLTIQTSIDGLRLIADRTGNYVPGREPTFSYDKQGKLFSATSYIKKRTKDGTWHEVSATAIYNEYKPKWANDFWDTKSHIMTAKCAEALALRKAFPAEMSRLHSEEEMHQAETIEVETTPRKVEESKTQIKQIEKISMTELNAFCDVLKECSPQYIKDVDDKLKEQGINEYFNIPKDLYEKLLPHAIRSKTKFKSQQMIDAQTGELHEEAVNE